MYKRYDSCGMTSPLASASIFYKRIINIERVYTCVSHICALCVCALYMANTYRARACKYDMTKYKNIILDDPASPPPPLVSCFKVGFKFVLHSICFLPRPHLLLLLLLLVLILPILLLLLLLLLLVALPYTNILTKYVKQI